jgi:uncharacterized coiled-coil DUF342 family protein
MSIDSTLQNILEAVTRLQKHISENPTISELDKAIARANKLESQNDELMYQIARLKREKEETRDIVEDFNNLRNEFSEYVEDKAKDIAKLLSENIAMRKELFGKNISEH